MSENPLKGYYLTRFYKGDDPYVTIMDLVREEAIAMCEKKTPNRRAGRDPDQHYEAYYEARVDVENWLRQNAEAAGVDIKAKNPVYFALTTEPEPPQPGRISIPAEDVDLSRCSFTFDDSFNNHTFFETHGERSGGIEPHPMHGVVLNAGQAAKALKKYGALGKYNEGDRYIEVQMWDRPPLDDPSQRKQLKPSAQSGACRV